MDRRTFIITTCKASLVAYFSNCILGSCNLNKENLNTIIGENKNILNNLTIEFIGNISCFSTENFDSKINGIKALIFCNQNTIIGYTIILNEKSISNKLHKNHSKRTTYNNEFGYREVWTDGEIIKSLSTPKEYKDIYSHYFYSEYLKEAESFIW